MAREKCFVLVHGAFHGGWCWRRVADRLVARGGRVLTPTLTGLGERSHLLRPEIDLDVHVQDVEQVILWEELDDLVLCGHSYGGAVISGAAERVHRRIRALVYLDAFVPACGKAVWDYVPDALRGAYATGPGPYLAPTSAAAFSVNMADREWVDRRSTPHPPATFHSRLPQTRHRDSIARKVYVQATGFPSPLLRPFADDARSSPDWVFHELAHGHDLMIDAPDAVAEILWASGDGDASPMAADRTAGAQTPEARDPVRAAAPVLGA